MHAQLNMFLVLGLLGLYVHDLFVEPNSESIIIYELVLQLIELLLLGLEWPLSEREVVDVNVVRLLGRGDLFIFGHFGFFCRRRCVHSGFCILALFALLSVCEWLIEPQADSDPGLRVLIADQSEVQPIIVENLLASPGVNDALDLDFLMVLIQQLVSVVQRMLGLLDVLRIEQLDTFDAWVTWIRKEERERRGLLVDSYLQVDANVLVDLVL